MKFIISLPDTSVNRDTTVNEPEMQALTGTMSRMSVPETTETNTKQLKEIDSNESSNIDTTSVISSEKELNPIDDSNSQITVIDPSLDLQQNEGSSTTVDEEK